MGHKLPPDEAELYRRCDEVLHYVWDPIGVSGSPGARDEYHSYLPNVFALVKDNPDAEKISGYLLEVEVSSMGLPGNPKRNRIATQTLLSWREWILGSAA